MEPKKLMSRIGVVIGAVTGAILFVIESDRIQDFFFPEGMTGLSYQFYTLSLLSVGLLIFYVSYRLYFREKERKRKLETELQNTKQLLFDSEKLRLVDFVTGIPNEQKFQIDLENRPKELYHLIIIDLDGFGAINKKNGFQKGDHVIRTIAQDLFLKMRRDEEIYKRSYKIKKSFTKRIYRKYTGGDEFIFMIKGDQHEAVGFITRVQKQLRKLTSQIQLSFEYDIKFHAAIISLYPNDTYEEAIDKLQRAFVQAAEEKDGMKVFWDKSIENKFSKKYGFIYENARTEFEIKKGD